MMTTLTPTHRRALRRRLCALYDELVTDVDVLDHERVGELGELSEVQADGGPVAQAREVDLELRAVDVITAREVLDALARLDTGSYGRCERCGGAIEGERLEALPWARTCTACMHAD